VSKCKPAIGDLIRQDMENRRIVSHVMNGLDDVKKERFSEKSILEIGLKS